MKKINLFLLIIFLIYSCSGFREAGKVLRNEKTQTTDEFLVKKKEPLVFPPDFNEVPEPGTLKKGQINEEEKIKKILKAPKGKDLNKSDRSSAEESILNRIRK
tara:strand:+ start:450 stop:758 length:309 start_codon:yes stop_codon:yes gene_type:complete